MKIKGVPYRTIWVKKNGTVSIIDQRFLPHRLVIEGLESLDDMCEAIRDMHLRGAPLIGVAAGFGMYLAALRMPSKGNLYAFLKKAGRRLIETRPTAVNLQWGVERQLQAVRGLTNRNDILSKMFETAQTMADEDVETCRKIGLHGYPLIEKMAQKKKGKPVNILTHCNAGWLACVDWGTATSPIYQAFNRGIKVHVWVDETRPRNQGASLTAWELGEHGVPHTVIADNTGGHLMQHGLVDLVIVGTDRTTSEGDVANKIGTYLKALAAHDNGIPFYVGLPSSTIDWRIKDGIREIPIEERSAGEVTHIQGWLRGRVETVRLTPEKSKAVNYGFDVTPRRFITGLITERGIAQASRGGLLKLFPERRKG